MPVALWRCVAREVPRCLCLVLHRGNAQQATISLPLWAANDHMATAMVVVVSDVVVRFMVCDAPRGNHEVLVSQRYVVKGFFDQRLFETTLHPAGTILSQKDAVGEARIELATVGFKDRRSTGLSYSP